MGQRVIMDALLHPARLQRIIDNQTRVKHEHAYGPSELLKHLTDAVWSELDDGSSISSFRRNLQLMYIEKLVDFVLNSKDWITINREGKGQVGVPQDVRALARLELSELSKKIKSVLNQSGPFDREDKAHLNEMKVKIGAALEASVELEP
jgi:hypothetical protein